MSHGKFAAAAVNESLVALKYEIKVSDKEEKLPR
jgi:hypothetical protein